MSAGATYEPISTTTLSGASSNVTFSSIPQTYTDLVLVTSIKNASTGLEGYRIQVNNDTGTNYSETYMHGDGSSASSSRITNNNGMNNGLSSSSSGSEYSINMNNFFNYTNTTSYKTVLSTIHAATNGPWLNVSVWRNTSAITSIKIANQSGNNFGTGSTFTLYGITAA